MAEGRQTPPTTTTTTATCTTLGPLAAVRNSTARVVAAASHVTIDRVAVRSLALELLPRLEPNNDGSSVAWDAEGWHYNADAASDGPLTAQYVLVLDALNWCFWPTKGRVTFDLRGLNRVNPFIHLLTVID